MDNVLFEEKQRFPSCMNVMMFVLLLVIVYFWYRSFNFALIPAYIIFALFPTILLNVMFLLAGLHVKISQELIQYRFTPFQWKMKEIKKEEIEYLYLKTYDPQKDHLGYGMTNKKDGKAFTLKGTKGLFIRLKDGMFILLGTQKTAEIQEVINSHYSELYQNE